jgi:hypothetical protein
MIQAARGLSERHRAQRTLAQPAEALGMSLSELFAEV